MVSMVNGGLDVHKESITAYLVCEDTGEIVCEQLVHDRARLLRAVRRWSKLGELHLCYKGSGAGFVLKRWLDEVGDTGTGKTHLAIALGLCVIQAGYRVRFITAVTLAQELLQAQQEYRLPRYLKSWQKVDLVILDELGYLGLGPGGPLLFQFCAERYELGSILITTNLDFARWTEVFGDARSLAENPSCPLPLWW